MRRLLILTLLVLLLSGMASAKGQISTIDVGHYNADEMKQAVPFAERDWANGTYSNTKLDPGGTVTFDLQDRLTMSATLAITTASGIWKWYPANQTGNMVFYRNAIANISYTDWDTILKEQIVLNAPVSVISWQVNLSVKPQTLTITTDGDDYLIKNPAYGVGWIRVRKPFVVDAKGTRRDLRYTWNNGQRRLTLVQDFSGLTYPLTIDPVYAVETLYNTGLSPVMLVNQSNVPQIVYMAATYQELRLAVNSSGSFSVKTMSGLASTGYGVGAIIDPVTDLPMAISPGISSTALNLTWWSSSKWRVGQTKQFVDSPPTRYNVYPMGKSSSSGSVFYGTLNRSDSQSGIFNITRVEGTSGTSISSYEYTIQKGLTSGFAQTSFSGYMNSTKILNIIWSAEQDLNLTTVTDSSSPTIYTKQLATSFINTSETGISSGIGSAINPVTDLLGITYKPVDYGSTTGRAVNYSYFVGGNSWYHEIAYQNTTSPGMSSIIFEAIAYNSSGTPYIAFTERANGPSSTSSNVYLSYVKRLAPNSWSSPVTIEGGLGNLLDGPYPPSIAFDQQDNLHIAWYNATTADLEYYFEALPAAIPGTPVAAFSCTPLAVVRNQTITCTDQSTNIPTSWDWYSPDAQQQVLFSGNDTRQNPQFFPHYLGGYFSVNLIATNAFGTSTKASGPQYIWVSKPWV
jgi:hypothetical protein